MKKGAVKKVMIFDQGRPAGIAGQLYGKARELFMGTAGGTDSGSADNTGINAAGGTDSDAVTFVIVKVADNHGKAAEILEKAIADEKPDVLLMGATALGESVAPILGVRLGTGVAAHCVDIRVNDEGRIGYMVPAFGGKVIGEIFIPDAEPGKPAIATVKPGMFEDCALPEKGEASSDCEGDALSDCSGGAAASSLCKFIDGDAMAADIEKGGFRMISATPRETAGSDIAKAQVILCGGFGIGSSENWEKLVQIADKLGGAAGCTRPVVDMGWGPDEYSMIGTSGRTVKPKVYVGFGISGAAHHVCGIQDAGVIISINNDKEAEVFKVSDYCGVFDAGQVIDELLKQLP